MVFLKVFLLTLVGYTVAQTSSSQQFDRQCPCTLSSLWVDVAVAIDTSTGMGTNGVIQVVADLASVFINSQIGPYNGQYTKVGVVTYDKTAKVQFNMTYFKNTDQFETDIWNVMSVPITKTESIVKSGIAAAAQLLTTVKKPNRKQAIIVYASDYKGDGEDDPTELARSLEASGICLITIAFNQGDGSVIQGLKSLACKGMFIKSGDADAVGHMQQNLCQINCYCPDTWHQYSDTYSNPTVNYGECLKFGEIASAWTPAKYACQNMAGGGYLATASSTDKVAYLKNMSLDDSTFSNMPHEFLVGLKYTNGAWNWEQGAVYTAVPADQNVPWLSGYPDSSPATNACGLVSPAEVSERSRFGLKNINCNTVAKRYTCEVNTCDTDIYCS